MKSTTLPHQQASLLHVRMSLIQLHSAPLISLSFWGTLSLEGGEGATFEMREPENLFQFGDRLLVDKWGAIDPS
jgi:hypothetical protein